MHTGRKRCLARWMAALITGCIFFTELPVSTAATLHTEGSEAILAEDTEQEASVKKKDAPQKETEQAKTEGEKAAEGADEKKGSKTADAVEEDAKKELEERAAAEERERREEEERRREQEEQERENAIRMMEEEVQKKGEPDAEQETRYVRVEDLTALSDAVNQETEPKEAAYEFVIGENTALVNGEEVTMDSKCTQKGEKVTVPAEVFADDDKVSAKAEDKKTGKLSEKTELAEIAEQSEYEMVREEDRILLESRYAGKCLMVKGYAEGMNAYGASTVILGYGEVTILFYENADETERAYEAFLADGMQVDVDGTLSAAALNEEKEVSAEAAVEKEKPKEESKEEPEESSESKESRDILVAVLDSGYDYEDGGKDRIVNGKDLTGSDDVQDGNGHGTLMCNIILESTQDAIKVMPVKIADEHGRSSAVKLYLGILYAIENRADIINISMSAYKSAHYTMIEEAVRTAWAAGIYVVVSAGNDNEDSKNYSPGNIMEALTVSAIDTKDVRDSYSNFGASVDFCSYGSVSVTGMDGFKASPSGTSVSAAIVSAVVADRIRKNNEITPDSMLQELAAEAADLGETGWDMYYGNGALKPELLQAEEETAKEEQVSGLLICDWKGLSDAGLNELIDAASELEQKRFLDNLTEEEKKELLAREDVLFNHVHTAVVYDAMQNQVDKFSGTLSEYLYSSFFDEYTVSGSDDKDYGNYNGTAPYWGTMSGSTQIHVATEIGKAVQKASITIKFSKKGTKNDPIPTNPADGYRVTVSATDQDTFKFADIKIAGRFLSGDDGTHNVATSPVLYATYINGIKVIKGKHATIKEYTVANPTGLYVGGFLKQNKNGTQISGDETKRKPNYGTNVCKDTSSTNVYLCITKTDIELGRDNDPKNDQLYTLKIEQHDPVESGWTYSKDNNIEDGKREKNSTCSNCKEVLSSSVQYLNYFTYAEENTDGSYTVAAKQNMDKTAFTDKNELNYLNVNTTVGNYTVSGAGTYFRDVNQVVAKSEAKARAVEIKRDRKKYTLILDGNGGTNKDANTYKDTRSIRFGESVTLDSMYGRYGYEFKGWGGKTDQTEPDYAPDFKAETPLTDTDNATVTLYAVWSRICYTVTYNGNGATEGTTAATEHKYGESEALAVNGFIRKSKITYNSGNDQAVFSKSVEDLAHTFDVWKLKGAQKTYTSGQVIEQKLTESNGAVLQMDAIWKKLTTTLPVIEQAPRCMEFVSWVDADGNRFEQGAEIEVSKDMVFTAEWQASVYKLTLDPDGADQGREGTKQVYEQYGINYFKDEQTKVTFDGNKIEIPVKHVKDDSIDEPRMQEFMGYFYQGITEIIQADGSLIADPLGNIYGNYTYFVEDAVLKVSWQPMYAVQFKSNLTQEDQITDEVLDGMPQTLWKSSAKDLTVEYKEPVVKDETWSKIYRFRGWSTTADGTGMLLTKENTSHTFSRNEDVILYAVWDTSYEVSYIGNEQSEGMDYLNSVKTVKEDYTFNPNEKEKIAELGLEADYHLKTVSRETIDIATGDAVDENGIAYTEEIPCSFQGWSMYDDKELQDNNPVYFYEEGMQKSNKIVDDAVQVGKEDSNIGLTIGNPVTEFGKFSKQHVEKMAEFNIEIDSDENEIPYVNMFAIWDEFPQIKASDLYFTLDQAQNGVLTEECLLDQAVCIDRENITASNASGELSHGIDDVNKTLFSIKDYQEADFTAAESATTITVTYYASDSASNVSEKTISIYLIDTSEQEYDTGKVRFISQEYLDTLEEDSVWYVNEEYANTLQHIMSFEKENEEYTEVSPVQSSFGITSRLIPGSGNWNKEPMQTWKFSHDEVEQVKEYIDSHGIGNSKEEKGLENFWNLFDRNRV